MTTQFNQNVWHVARVWINLSNDLCIWYLLTVVCSNSTIVQCQIESSTFKILTFEKATIFFTIHHFLIAEFGLILFTAALLYVNAFRQKSQSTLFHSSYPVEWIKSISFALTCIDHNETNNSLQPIDLVRKLHWWTHMRCTCTFTCLYCCEISP